MMDKGIKRTYCYRAFKKTTYTYTQVLPLFHYFSLNFLCSCNDDLFYLLKQKKQHKEISLKH